MIYIICIVTSTLTLKAHAKNNSENVNCLSRLHNFPTIKQKVYIRIKHGKGCRYIIEDQKSGIT